MRAIPEAFFSFFCCFAFDCVAVGASLLCSGFAPLGALFSAFLPLVSTVLFGLASFFLCPKKKASCAYTIRNPAIVLARVLCICRKRIIRTLLIDIHTEAKRHCRISFFLVSLSWRPTKEGGGPRRGTDDLALTRIHKANTIFCEF
nr:hypothetical protein [Pandoravirus aubagnensis]